MQFKQFVGMVSLVFVFSTPVFATQMPTPIPCTDCVTNFPVGLWTWNYVLNQTPETSITANMYDIDMFDNTAATVSAIHTLGRKAVCYIDAGTWENWRPDASQFPSSVLGDDNGWPGEKWLDIRQTAILFPIMQNRVNECKSKGFDAVEFDNVDGYTNTTGFPLTADEQAFYDSSLANMAHEAGLRVALKNDVGQVETLISYFDFTINEQCFQYDECNTLQPFITANKAVFNVEYSLQPASFCSKANSMKFSSIKKKLALNNTPVTFCN